MLQPLMLIVSHTAGCGVPDTTPAAEIMYQYAQGAQKPKRPKSHQKNTHKKTIISQYEFISNEKRDTEVIITVEKVRKRPRKGDEEGVEKV